MAKGQIWGYDLLVATSIFIFSLAIVMFLSLGVSTGTRTHLIDDLSNSAWDFSGVLMAPGNPSNWNATVNPANQATWTDLTLIGILDSFDSPQISGSKGAMLLQMNATNYSALKTKFRTGYDFYVEVSEFFNCTDGNITSSPFYNCTGRGITEAVDDWYSLDHPVRISGKNFTFGLDPDANGARFKAVANRIAVYNDSIVRVRVILWTNETQ
ncbi:Uncharacterised protein [uncultured archaeon]|nr:Uncharacterised protein [uncultured archaeon]